MTPARPKLYRLRQPSDHRLLEQAAAADAHGLILPTHAVLKDNKIVGAFGLPAAPLVTVWMDTRQANAFDSLLAIQEASGVMREAGHSQCIVACADTSPFFAKMDKLGMTRLAVTTLHLLPL